MIKIKIEEIFPDNREKFVNESKLRQIQLIELRILKMVDYILEKHNIQYWLDWGNLIGAVRHKGFIPWDDDIDLGIKIEDYEKAIEILIKELPEDIFVQTPFTDKDYNNYEGIKLRDKFSSLSGIENINKNDGIFIEIFPMYKVPNSKLLQKIQIFLYRTFISSRIDKSIRFKIRFRRIISKFLTKFISLNSLDKKILDMYKITKTYKYRHALHSSGKEVDFYFTEKSIFPLKKVEYEGSFFYAPNDIHDYLTVAFGDYMQLPPVESRKPGHMNVDKVIIDIRKN